MAIDQVQFRQILSRFASGVTVITTRIGERNYGMTVSSFTSLSLEPPLILFCANNNLQTNAAVREAGSFAVHILGDDQEAVSRRFATRDIDKFADLPWHLSANNLPIVENCLAVLECRVSKIYSEGDHTIFIGEVLDGAFADGEPLLYFHRNYRKLQ